LAGLPEREKFDKLRQIVDTEIQVSAVTIQLGRMINAQILELPAHWCGHCTGLGIAQKAQERLRDPQSLAVYWRTIVFMRGRYLSGGRQEFNFAASMAILDVVGEMLSNGE